MNKAQILAVAALSMGLATCPLSAENIDGFDVELPNSAMGSLLHQGRLYVATGSSGVLIFSIEGNVASLQSTLHFDGQAIDITELSGQPWVVLQTLSAQPLKHGTIQSVPIGEAQEASPKDKSLVKVTAVENNTAIIAMGAESGSQVGDYINITRQEVIEIQGVEGVEGAPLTKERVVALGRITVLGQNSSQVTLLRGGRTQEGDFAERLEEAPKNIRLTPDRLGGIYEVSMTLRPFLAVGTLGLGSINEFAATYYGNERYFAQINLQPFSMGWSRDGNLMGLSATGTIGYDNPYFALGLGFGLTAANTGITETGSRFLSSNDYATDESGGGSYSFEQINVQRAPTVSQIVRFGARDGLNLELRNTFVMAPIDIFEDNSYYDEETDEWVQVDPVLVDSYKEFRWASTSGKLTVPLSEPTDVFIDISGGSSGFFYVAGGVSTWLKGNGDRGSLGLSASAGYGLLQGTPDEDYISLMGPMVGFGMRSRF